MPEKFLSSVTKSKWLNTMLYVGWELPGPQKWPMVSRCGVLFSYLRDDSDHICLGISMMIRWKVCPKLVPMRYRGRRNGAGGVRPGIISSLPSQGFRNDQMKSVSQSWFRGGRRGGMEKVQSDLRIIPPPHHLPLLGTWRACATSLSPFPCLNSEVHSACPISSRIHSQWGREITNERLRMLQM